MKFDGFDANLSIHGAQSVRGSSGSGNLRGLLVGGGALFRSVFGGVAAAVVDAVLDGGRLEGVLAGRGGAAGASFAAPGLQPLSDGDSGDHQDGDGVGPGPTECGVEKQAGQKHGGQVGPTGVNPDLGTSYKRSDSSGSVVRVRAARNLRSDIMG